MKQRRHTGLAARFAVLFQQEKARQSGTAESGDLSEVRRLKGQLETSEEQRKDVERQLSEAGAALAQLQGEGQNQEETMGQKYNNMVPIIEKRLSWFSFDPTLSVCFVCAEIL